MKQSIYQKLLLSLAIAAFFVTLTSAQVINRSQVSPEMIEMKKKAKAQGLKVTPIERTEKAKIERRTQQETTVQKTTQLNKPIIQRKEIIERKIEKKKSSVASSASSIFEKTRAINEKMVAEGDAPRASVVEVAGKRYIQVRPKEQVKFEIKNQ